MTSIIKPEDYPEIRVEPITKKYWKEFTIVVEFTLNFATHDRYHSLSDLKEITLEHAEGILGYVKTRTWLENNLEKKTDYRSRVTEGEWHYPDGWSWHGRNDPKNKRPPTYNVYLKDADHARALIEESSLSVHMIRSLVSETHAEQLGDATDRVVLRKQNYWDTYNVKIIGRHWSIDRNFYSECCETFGSYNVKREGRNLYLKITDDDGWAELAMLRLQHDGGADISEIVRVEIIGEQTANKPIAAS